MKINISFLPENIHTYNNHSILANQGNVQLVQYDDNQLEEILAINVIEYLPRAMFDQIINHWITKLSHKGKLVVDFVDLYTVSRLFFLQQLQFQDVNTLLHGEMKVGWDEKKLNLTVPQLSNTLETFGLKVISKKLDGVKATIIAERP